MADNVILLLTDEHVDWAVEKVDNLIPAKNVIVEAIDGPFARITISYLNKSVSKYVPDDLKDELHAALDDVIAEEYDDAIENAFEVIETLINKTQLSPAKIELLISLLSLVKAALKTLV